MGYDDTLYLKILRDTWGYSDFRGIQRDIIRSIAEGKDTLGLMPTGGGKSLTFQVPALAMEGVCIVITPLIALMKDQVDNLRRRQVLAAAIYSGMSRQEIVKTLENCVLGHTKILYVSPERIGSELFQTKLAHIKVSFITIDEAHCISQWGYDFRPSYLHIADIRRIKPDAPILALTATATTEVIDDIQEQLEFKEKNVFRMSFERKNLAYVVRSSDNKMQQLIHILNSISGSAIVYVRSRKLAKEISEYILNNNISATFYHAGLEHSTKDERQKKWHDDEVRVMVATNAFGMGIDKPDVRVVIHISCPDSIEAYFQEAGRAGRDGKKAYAVLLYDRGDRTPHIPPLPSHRQLGSEDTHKGWLSGIRRRPRLANTREVHARTRPDIHAPRHDAQRRSSDNNDATRIQLTVCRLPFRRDSIHCTRQRSHTAAGIPDTDESEPATHTSLHTRTVGAAPDIHKRPRTAGGNSDK